MKGSRAAPYVRVRVWKSRLLDRVEASSLMTAGDSAAVHRVLAALGIETPFARLVSVYRMALREYPGAAPLLHSLLRLHELENVKLLWRTVLRGRNRAAARRLWIPLGPLATVEPETLEATNARALVTRLAPTPFATIAGDLVRSHALDGAAELALDRWGSLQVLAAARALPKRESLACRLAESVVLERDAEILRRGERWFGLSSASSSTAAARKGGAPAVMEIRLARLRLCRRAFVGDPFTTAPAVALVLLAEAEFRGIRALIERQGDAALDDAAARAMAGAGFAP